MRYERILGILSDKRSDYLLIFAAVVASTLLWFPIGKLVIGANTFVTVNLESWMHRYLFAWNSWIDLGLSMPSILQNSPLAVLIYFCFRKVGMSFSISQMVYITLFSFIGAISVYRLTSRFAPQKYRRPASLFASLFFLHNPVFIQAGMDISSQIPYWASFLLFFSLYVDALDKKELKYGLILGLASTLLMYSFPTGTARIAIFMGFFSLAYTVMHFLTRRESLRKEGIFFAKLVGIIALISILVNFYLIHSILAQLHALGEVYSGYYAPWPFGEYTTLPNVFRLIYSWGFFTPPYPPPYTASYLYNPCSIFLTFLLPILAFSAILVKRSRYIIFLSITSLFTLFLFKGITPPFGELYRSMVSAIPLFKFFYYSGSFAPFLMFQYCILAGITLGKIYEKVGSLNTHKLLRRCVVSLSLITIILASAWPIVSGDFVRSWYRPNQKGIQMPQSYYHANDWLNSQEGHFNTLVIPRPRPFVSTTWGYEGAQFYDNIFTKPMVTSVGGFYGMWISLNPTVRELLDYVYNMPFKSPYLPEFKSVNLARETGGWAVYHDDVDSVQADVLDYPAPSSPNVRLTISHKLYEPNAHLAYYRFPTPQDWRKYNLLVVQFKMDPSDIENLRFGVGDDNGCVGWYVPLWHMVSSTQGFHTLYLLLGTPDQNDCDLSRVQYVDVCYFTPRIESDNFTTIWISEVSVSVGRLASESWGKLLGLLNVKYLFVDFSDTSMASLGTFYMRLIGDLSAFSLEWTEDNLSIYRNKLFTSIIYPSTDIYIINSTSDILDVTSKTSFRPNVSSFIYRGEENRVSQVICRPESSADNISVLVLHSSPTKYKVHVASERPFLLIFGQSYNEEWKAFMRGTEVKERLVVNGYANGWILPKGEYDVILSFDPQGLYSLSVWVSLGSILACFFVLGFWFARQTCRKRQIKKLKRS